ncbi:hypothetical protein [Paenibacillus silvae]|uniref:Uncharacterized protein n=1 Tax=Paenibacillus silvae TaxID=1325358 RepID=A0A2W6P1G4_9BACL|nr:hypothetical protein [Paenibacillus silvae]PZT52006.1 hypothetical protein DN757_29720 [Paenibacillus silvae]
MNNDDVVVVVNKEDVEDTNKIIQLNFFSDVDEVDIRKTKWLLGKYIDMMDIIQNYEFALSQIENGMSAYELLSAEGSVSKRESGHELTADVTANSVIMKDKRHDNYKLYVFISNNVRFAINNLKDPHEGVAARLLFLEGKKYLKAQEYMEKGYRKDVPGIAATTFADKRRRAIANIANSLKFNRTLDFVTIDYGRGRNSEGEIGLLIPS